MYNLKALALVMFATLMLFSNGAIFAQNGKADTTVFLKSCKEACPGSEKTCHYKRAIFLLYDDERDSSCTKTQMLDPLGSIARAALGITEFESAISNSPGDKTTALWFELELAAGKLELSRLYLENKNTERAGQLMKDAGEIYYALAQPTNLQKDDFNEYIIMGLIRSGRSLDAIRALTSLSQDDPSRAYLTGEALFSIGNRKGASEEYERWIKLGCSSKPLMIVSNGRRKEWTFLLSTSPSDLTLCEQLPSELRSRFDNLVLQYGHPNNLPKRSYPGMLFRNLIF